MILLCLRISDLSLSSGEMKERAYAFGRTSNGLANTLAHTGDGVANGVLSHGQSLEGI